MIRVIPEVTNVTKIKNPRNKASTNNVSSKYNGLLWFFVLYINTAAFILFKFSFVVPNF